MNLAFPKLGYNNNNLQIIRRYFDSWQLFNRILERYFSYEQNRFVWNRLKNYFQPLIAVSRVTVIGVKLKIKLSCTKIELKRKGNVFIVRFWTPGKSFIKGKRNVLKDLFSKVCSRRKYFIAETRVFVQTNVSVRHRRGYRKIAELPTRWPVVFSRFRFSLDTIKVVYYYY